MAKEKKLKKISFNSVRSKLIAITIIIVVVPLIALGYLSYNKSFDILKNKLTVTSQQMVNEVNNSVNEYLLGLESQAIALSENSSFKTISSTVFTLNTGEGISNTNDTLERAIELLKNVQESNSSIVNAYLGTEDGRMYIYPEIGLPEGYDPRTKPWYTLASAKSGSVIWTDSYVDANTGDIVISAARTVVSNGKILGVVAIDIDLNLLSAELSKKTVGQKGYIFVTDKNGIMLAHPNSELIGTDESTKQSFWENVKSNEKGFDNYEYDGDKKFLSFTTNSKTGWKLLASLDEAELLNDTNIIKNFTIYVVLASSLLAALISIFIALSISRPLNLLKEAFERAATGDLTAKAKITSKDEFGNIGESFNTMIKNISSLIKEVQKSSYTVFDSSNSLAEITEQTAASTNEVAVTIEEIAKSAGEQAKDTENGAIQIKELANTIELVEDSANNMNEVATKTNKLTNEGLEIVKLLTEKSKENNQSSINVNKIVLEVDKNAQEIGTITEAISQIAEQTNLLALNAAIEAARAGEHGKGFAVVAEEVRKLAEQSSSAATKVKELIDGIQNRSKIAVESIDEAKTIAQENEKAVEETRRIFTDIANTIKTLIENVKEIKEQTNDMTHKKNEIVAIIENLSAASEETSAATQQVSAATEEQLAAIQEVTSHSQNLKSLANSLQEIISRFKVDNN